MIEILIRPDVSAKDVAAMGRRIAEMSEVGRYTYISQEKALEMLPPLGENADELLGYIGPCPSGVTSFRIMVHGEDQVEVVTHRLVDDPIVYRIGPGAEAGLTYLGQ